MRRLAVRLTVPLAAVAVLSGVLSACGEDGTIDDEPADPGAAAGDTVTAASFAFDPSELTVPAGTTVTFVNEDSARHTFTSGDGEPDGTFDLEAGEGESAEFTFDDAGTYPFFCQVHPSMTGTITVE